jgi:16S rRNA (adenine1518-N6/adenine1519-N6)-dimethyltransferase
MDFSDVSGDRRGPWMNKRLGQNMLVNRQIAQLEAEYGKGKTVLEMGTGTGMLTKELCECAKKVISVERDSRLFEVAKEALKFDNLELINSDFFEVPEKETGNADIMISNVPYNLSSKVIMWLQERQIPAVLCLQKEFVGHMMAASGGDKYSKLSVICALQFKIESVMIVKAGNFFPRPKVDSEIIRVVPKGVRIPQRQIDVLSMLMEHKKKKVRNAVVDSSSALSISKEEARSLSEFVTEADLRVFQLDPTAILHVARSIVENIG